MRFSGKLWQSFGIITLKLKILLLSNSFAVEDVGNQGNIDKIFLKHNHLLHQC